MHGDDPPHAEKGSGGRGSTRHASDSPAPSATGSSEEDQVDGDRVVAAELSVHLSATKMQLAESHAGAAVLHKKLAEKDVAMEELKLRCVCPVYVVGHFLFVKPMI
jgi:hypothetical protein